MSQWIIQALLPIKPKLQIILRYRMTKWQRTNHGPWGPSSLWLFSPNLSIKGGSKVWHHITESWKVMARTSRYLPPSTPENILQLSMWWRTGYQGLYFGITMSRALTLYMKGLRYFRDTRSNLVVTWKVTP
jgi:hypothetical protein